MATTKSTNPKNTELENEILKAAGTGTPPPLDQQGIKDQAAAISDQANKTAGETIPGKTETMQGQPGEAVQMAGSNLPPVASTQTLANDPQYAEFLAWKVKQAAGGGLPATNQPGQPLAATPQLSDFEKRKQEAEAAALKVYHDILNGTGGQPTAQATNTNTADVLHAERLRVYGPGYVVARRAGIEQVFTQQTWKLLGGRNNKDGYTEVVATPPEVQNLKKAQ